MVFERYKRQVSLFGEGGQERLCGSKVFIAGAGGLGSPVATYLALAGVGNIVIADYDTVEITNLNRQHLHSESDIGCFKADSAKAAIKNLNPKVSVSVVKEALDENNAAGVIKGCDIIIDCLDNFEARHILNSAAIGMRIPLIHGAVSGWDGQATTIIPGETPCTECLFPQNPTKERFPIVGTTAGVIGTIQANEVLRILTGNPATMAGKLLVWDGQRSSLEEIPVLRDERCPACSEII